MTEHPLPFDEAARTLSAAPDARVAAFALGVSVLTLMLFGLAPALQSTRPVLTSTLKDESGSVVGGTGHARFRKGLVVAQVGLSVLLFAGAALFARSLYNLKSLNPGFQADQLLGFSLDPSLNGYPRARTVALFQQLQDELSTLPDVRAATASVIPLMTDSNWSSTVRVEGYKAKEGEDMNPDVEAVAPGFFATLGQPLVVGREFTVKDVAGAPKVAIIKEVALMVAIGVAAGLPLAIALSRVVQTQLFALSAHDPLALAGAAAILAIVALVAGSLPARRATRVDPMLALRYE